MDYHRKAAEHLLEDDLTPQKAVSLTYAATEIGEQDDLYETIESTVDHYLESTDDMLRSSSGTGEEIKLSDLRGILTERRESLKNATESAYGLDEANMRLINDFQQSYLFLVRDDIVQDGEAVEILQN